MNVKVKVSELLGCPLELLDPIYITIEGML